MNLSVEQQYLNICQRVVDHGVWVPNDRTGIPGKTLISEIINIPVENAPYPVFTTRKSPTVMPIREKLGYLQGLDNAADFEKIGAKTWYANANESQGWLNNPNRKGENDCGRIYGVQARKWQRPDGKFVDQLAKVINNLSRGIDDRGEIITYFNPGEFDLGCLRPCMHTHQFSLLGNDLYLDSYQRSADLALGSVANVQQVYFFLRLMAQLTGKNAKHAKLHMTNCHIYENQYEQMRDIQLKREIITDIRPELHIDPRVKTLEDIDTWVNGTEFTVTGYDNFHAPIDYPFAA